MKSLYLVYNSLLNSFGIADSRDSPYKRRTDFEDLGSLINFLNERYVNRKMDLVFSKDIPERDLDNVRKGFRNKKARYIVGK